MCYSAAPSTTNQNATKGTYKGYKVARKSLQAYSIKMQYEIVIKSDRWCSCYTCLPRTAQAAAQTALKMALGSGLMLLQQLNVYSRSQRQNKSTTYTYMQTIAKTKKQYNNT